jgi:hypothetical protein
MAFNISLARCPHGQGKGGAALTRIPAPRRHLNSTRKGTSLALCDSAITNPARLLLARGVLARFPPARQGQTRWRGRLLSSCSDTATASFHFGLCDKKGKINMKYLAVIVSIVCFSSLALAQDFEIGPDGFRIETPHYRHHHECEEMRQACIHKHELGEEGHGNCERYRRECGDRD